MKLASNRMTTVFPGAFGALLLGGLLVASTGCEVRDCDETPGQVDADMSMAGASAQDASDDDDGACAEAVSLKTFKASPVEDSAPWQSGDAVVVRGFNGDIHVVQGSADEVGVTFEGFVSRAYDTPQDVIDGHFEDLNLDVTAEAGTITIETSRRSGAPATLGADLTISLPPDFDGSLKVIQGNGLTDVDFVGSASKVLVESDNGFCDVNVGASATTSEVRCDSETTVTVRAALPGSGPHAYVSTFGGLKVDFSAVSSPFTVRARTLDAGEVLIGNAESAGCTVKDEGDALKTISCYGATEDDPYYYADAEGTSLSDVELFF